MIITIFTINSLAKDFNDYEHRYPVAWEDYLIAFDSLVAKAGESLLGGAVILTGTMTGWICCTHFYPGLHNHFFSYLVEVGKNSKLPSGSIPKHINDLCGNSEITRFVDYEAYYTGLSKVIMDIERYNNALNRREEYKIDIIKLLWSIDGDPRVIEAINQEVLDAYNSKIKIVLCCENQSWLESLSALED